MSYVRIVCKRPPQPERGPNDGIRYPRLTLLPSFRECDILLVDDDGVEHPIDGVTSVSWNCQPNEVPVARLEIQGVEIDAEGLLELTKSPPTEREP